MTDATATLSDPRHAAPGALIALLEHQAGLYQQLHTLAARQGELVDGQPDALLAVLSQRQKLVDQLIEDNRKVEVFRARWAELTAGLVVGQRERINALLDQIGSLRDAILHHDETDVNRLSRNRNELARELARVSHSGRAARAYHAPQMPVGTRFTDQRG